MLNIGEIHDALQVAEIVIGALLLIGGVVMRASFVPRRDHTVLVERLAASETVAASAVNGINVRLTAIDGQVQVLAQRIEGVDRSVTEAISRIELAVQRIENFLLTQKAHG
jgi:uncharacterized membrane protein